MNARDALTKLVVVERERDQLREVNCTLRDKLLEIAKECSKCRGTGLRTIHFPGTGFWRDDLGIFVVPANLLTACRS
jgi:hypothetical protein